MNQQCIDTHIHVWNFQRAHYSWLNGNRTILNRNYLIEELEPQLREVGVQEGVLVQAANTIEETRYMLDVAENTTWVKGVVGWLPLQHPEEVDSIITGGYATHPLFKGVRHLIHDEPDHQWLLQPAVIKSLQLVAATKLTYDVVGILTSHLETVLKLLDKVDGLILVLDHLNQPPIQMGQRFGKWGDLMTQLARHSHVYAKISGLGTTAGRGENWDVDTIKPYVEFVIQQFGVERCFCGGDWPVSLLAGSFKHSWQTYQATLSSLLNETELKKVLFDNANQFYRLNVDEQS
jgi:L-fuconolactonase